MCVLRDQRPDGRPSFTEVFDELLEIEREAPEAKHTEVRACILPWHLF